MGQFYKVVNLDKKECLNQLSFNSGSKLMEFSYLGNHRVIAMGMLLSEKGRWHGDRVLVVGDYADEITLGEETFESLYYKADEFKALDYKDMDFKSVIHFRFIINNEQKLFIDTEHCPIERAFKDENGKVYMQRISPLPLLLAEGNGEGGGDFYGHNTELVGSWAEDAGKIETSDSAPEGYEEFNPDFTEKENLVPWTDAEKLLAAE